MFSSARKAVQNNPTLEVFLRGLVRNLGLDGAREAVQQASTVAPRSPIQDAMNQAGAIRMGVRQLPDLPPRAPKPEFPVPEGSPVIRRLQQLRQEIGPMQGPRETTSADYIFQPAIRGMRNPAGMQAPGTMFSRTGKVTEPGTKIGGRMMSGEYPNSPMRTVVRETEMQVSPGQGELPLDFRSNKEVMAGTQPMVAPVVADSMRPTGVQVTDLSGINPRDLAILAGAGTAGAVLGSLGDNKKPAEESSADGATSLTAEESAALNEYMSNILTSAGQNPGALNDVIRRNAPRSPETYQNPYEYQEDVARFVAGLNSGQFRDEAAALEAELSGAILDPEAPGIREQTNEQVTTGSVGSALGNANTENAVGQAEAAGANARIAGMGGTLEGAAEAQKNNEIIDATRPIVTSELSRVQDFMREQAEILNSQAEIQRRIKADSEAAMRAGMSPMAQKIRFEGDIRDRDIQARATFDPRIERR